MNLCIVTGGVTGGRPIDRTSRFELAAERALEEPARRSLLSGEELTSCLKNVIWLHAHDQAVLYSDRAAGDLVAALLGQGDYQDWFCLAVPRVLSLRAVEAMRLEGWRPYVSFFQP